MYPHWEEEQIAKARKSPTPVFWVLMQGFMLSMRQAVLLKHVSTHSFLFLLIHCMDMSHYKLTC